MRTNRHALALLALCTACSGAAPSELSSAPDPIADAGSPAPDPGARTCTYGMGHEFPAPAQPKQVVKTRDASLCLKCGLHPKNPASAGNGCEHEYA